MRPRLWLALAWAALLLSCLKAVANPDVFWHLSAGERILAEHAIPRADWLSFTQAGAPWTDFEWLTQAVYALLYRAGGWWALIALKTALIAAAAWLITRRLPSDAAKACGVAALAAAWATANEVRPDWFSLVLFAGELSLLEAKLPAKKKAALAFAGGALWANLHAGFVAGLAVAAASLSVPVFLGGLLGTLLNPFGPKLWLVVLEHLRAAETMSRHILEWRWSTPANFTTLPFWALLAFAAYRRKWTPALLGLALMGALHQRNIAYFAAAAVLLIPARAWAAPVVLASAAFLAFMPQQLTRSGLREDKWPSGAAAYIEAHPDLAAKKLYNPWNWGGYLGWSLRPPYRVYMDGRYLFHDQLGATMAAAKDPESWARFLDAQGIEGALMPRDQRDLLLTYEDGSGVRREKRLPYLVLFMPPDQWSLAYEDELSALYLRKKR